MLDQRIPTEDLDLAAAFVTLGVRAKLEPHLDERSGREASVWYLSTQSTVFPAFSTAQVMKSLKATMPERKLENLDGHHPILYALSGIKNWHALRSGRPLRLVKCGKWDRAIYVRSEYVTPAMTHILPPAPNADTCGTANDPKLDEAAAAGTCGLVFHRGVIYDSRPPFEPTTIEELRALPGDGEFGYLYALKAIGNWRQLRDYVDKVPRLIRICSPHNAREAFVVEHITPTGLDKMRRFLNGGRP